MSQRSKQRQARRLEEQKGSDMKKFYVILGVVAVIGIGAVSYPVLSGAMSGAVAEPVDLGQIEDADLVRLARGVERGDPSAPITILEFADYQCPGCGSFATQIKPVVDLNLVQSGTAKFVFYDFPLIGIHSNAFLAARAGRCAEDQGRFWEYHDKLFQTQPRWAAEGNPAGSFIGYAEELGLDRAAFSGCLNSDRHAELVTANMRLGEALGVNGTPTIMVHKGRGMARRLPSYDWPTIQSAVEELGNEGG